uniref:Sperm autoantigenic protein 17 n=1 Tax=Fundulus heteroclitus TaxID=8078 RepID=A0A3Q2NZN4_FUNHE
MSVPFSNTHLRVPRGFGAVLEGLAREVLRDQPDDIPSYAAQYFDKLLKQRQESGLDPAEWAARLEDRFYNNHAFKNTETASPEKKTAAQETASKEKSYKSQSEDEPSLSEEDATLSAKQPLVSDETDSAESTDDDEENNDPTEENAVSHDLRHTEETSGADKQSDEQSGTDEENELTTAKPNEMDGPHNDVNPALDCTTTQLDLDLSNLSPAEELSNVDGREVGAFEYEEEDRRDGAFEDKEVVGSEREEDAEVAEPVASLPDFALSNVDVCASELGGTERTSEDVIYQKDADATEEEETIKHQFEETDVKLLPSQPKIPQEIHQEAEDHAEKPNERETTETEASLEETNKGLAHSENPLDNTAIPKEDSLAEISFEDVPEDQCITEGLKKKLEEDSSMEVELTNISEMPQKDEFKELATGSTDMVGTEDQHKAEKEIIKREVIAEEEELESHHTAFNTLKDKGETNNVNYINDDERDMGGISPELENKMKDYETDDKGRHIEEIFDDKPNLDRETEEKERSNEQGAKKDETTDKVCTEGDSETDDQDMNDSGAIQNPSQPIELELSVTEITTEDEPLEENRDHLPEPNEQRPEIVGESQSEDVEEEKQDAIEQEVEMANSEVQEQSEELEKEKTITPTGSADWTAADHEEEERPAGFEEDTAAPANKSEKANSAMRGACDDFPGVLHLSSCEV